MKEISRIIIACYKKDFYLTRICVASIRYFYPVIEIYLLKDLSAGQFSTKEVEQNWNVKILNLERKKFGWGLSKLEPLFFNSNEKILVLDSDIVFIGKVINELEKHNADFIVSGEITDDLDQKWIKNIYYDIEKVLEFDKDFKFPGFLFNTGNFVMRTNLFKREEFNRFITWSETPKLNYSEIFSCADQGILNYLISKKIQNKSFEVSNIPFMLWGHTSALKDITLEKVVSKSVDLPYLIHWAGTRHYLIRKMCKGEILVFFENYYYSKVSLGYLKKNWRFFWRNMRWYYSSMLNFMKRINK